MGKVIGTSCEGQVEEHGFVFAPCIISVRVNGVQVLYLYIWSSGRSQVWDRYFLKLIRYAEFDKGNEENVNKPRYLHFRTSN